MRSSVVMAIAALLGALMFASLADRAYRYVVAENARARLDSIVLETTAQAELSIDHAVVALTRLMLGGHVTCTPDAIRAFQRAVYSSGRVKDVRIHSEAGRCSAFEDTSAFDLRLIAEPELFYGRNPNIALFVQERSIGNTLGVSWGQGVDWRLTAILGFDSLMFDLLPVDIRNIANVTMTLADKAVIAHSRVRLSDAPATDIFSVHGASERYPVAITLAVPTAYLKADDIMLRWLAVLVAALIGGTIAGLVARLATLPVNPVTELRRAIRKGEIVPFIQPIFALGSQEIIGGEILARWIRPDGSMVPPSSFIIIAERAGLTQDMTWQLLDRALCDTADVLRRRPGFKLAVNVPVAMMLSNGFVQRLKRQLKTHELRDGALVVELTERGEIENPEAVRECIAALDQIGVPVALDDTGTGHNGLGNVHALRPAVIKIDKMFVDDLDDVGTGRMIVEMLVGLARRIGAVTVAEGIETREQAEILQRSGVDQGQGYLVAPALSIDRYRAVIGEGQLPGLGNLAHDRRPLGRLTETGTPALNR